MDPTLIAFAGRGAIRLGHEATLAYEQYSRDKAVLFPDSLVNAMSDEAALNDALVIEYPHILKLIKADDALKGLWRDSPEGPVDEEAAKILRAVLIKEGVAEIAAQPGTPRIPKAEMLAGRLMIEQWAEGKGPASPLIPVALTMVDIGLEFVAANPQMTGANGNAAKIIGALADNLAGIIPLDARQIDVRAVFGEQLVAAFLRAGLDAVAKNANAIIREDHIRDLAVNALGPIIKSLPADAADLVEPMNWSEVTQVLTGAAAQAAIGTIAAQPEAFLGSKFRTEVALGALTQAMLAEAAKRRLEDNFTETGYIAIFRSAVGVAASRPELIMGKPDNAVDAFKTDVFANMMKVLAVAEPPFDGDLGARIAAASLDAVKDHATTLLDVDDDWDEVAAAATGMIIDGLKDGIVQKDPEFLGKVFTDDKLTELARVFLTQVATTPGMIVGTATGPAGEKAYSVELKRIVAAVSTAMAADAHLLLTADDWIAIAGIAAAEAAANPGALFGLDPADGGEAVLTGLIETVLRVASASITTVTQGGTKKIARQPGDVLFGKTLRDALDITLRTATGNIRAIADPANDQALKDLLEWLAEEAKRRAATPAPGAQPEEQLGAREWLLLYRLLLPKVLSARAFVPPTPAEVESVLKGAGP
jgi:hypothetical protein